MEFRLVLFRSDLLQFRSLRKGERPLRRRGPPRADARDAAQPVHRYHLRRPGGRAADDEPPLAPVRRMAGGCGMSILAFRGFAGVRLEAEAIGAADDPAVLLIHGAGQTRAVWGRDRKSTRLNSSHYCASRMPSSA